jgi:uncharacterized membrane protein YdjX (TVP38/TMEM64 family)
MYKKVGLGALYLLFALFIYLNRDILIGWIERGDLSAIPLVLGVAMLVASVPVLPYPLVSGVIGATYGPLLGGAISWLASTLASLLMFLLLRYLFQDFGQRLLHNQQYKKVDRLTSLFERNAFFTILIARLLPIVPSVAINSYAALSRVSFAVFALASAVGKIPAMALFAVAGNQAVHEPRLIVLTLVAYALFLLVTWLCYRWWTKQKLPRHLG